LLKQFSVVKLSHFLLVDGLYLVVSFMLYNVIIEGLKCLEE